jgi:uncharacterized protein (TIGR03086 family)
VLDSGIVAVLERSVVYALGSVCAVEAADLARTTPCRGWDLADLLAHLNDSLAALLDGGAEGRIPLAQRVCVTDLVETFRSRATAVLDAWTGTRVPRWIAIGDAALPALAVIGAGAMEIAVHGWDVAQARGEPRTIPPALAGALLALSPVLVDSVGREPGFAPPVEVAPGAGPGERLVAHLGRDPWQDRSPVQTR